MGLSTTWKDEYEEKINLNEAKFIFQQAEIKLKDTIETGQLIVARTVTIAGISVSIMIAVVAYLFTKWDTISMDLSSLLMLKISAVYYFILNIIIISNLHPSKYKIQGSNPSQLYVEHFFKKEYDNDENNSDKRLLELYKVTIAGYEQSINENKTLNIDRWRLFRLSLWLLTLSPIAILIIYFLIFFFR
jgi:hypothetical protein